MKNSARFQCDVPYPRLLLPQQLALAEPRAEWTCFWGRLDLPLRRAAALKVTGWLEETTLALKRVLDFEVSDPPYW
jgi:hypothetical protein